MPHPQLRRSAALLFLLFVAAPHPASSAPGDLDTTFATGGLFLTDFDSPLAGNRGQRVVVDSQDRPLLAVTILAFGQPNTHQAAVLRLTPAGVLDTTFNPLGPTPGVVVLDFQVPACSTQVEARGIALTADERIVVIADVCVSVLGTQTGIARLDATGAYDDTFSDDGRLVTAFGPPALHPVFIQDVEIDAMDRIYVGGSRSTQCSASCLGTRGIVARFTSAGVLDTTYNAAGTNPGVFELAKIVAMADQRLMFFALALTDDERIVAAGNLNLMGGLVARILDDGTLDTTFNPSGDPPGTALSDMGRSGSFPAAQAFGVDVASDDSVLITGQAITGASQISKLALAKLTSTGAPDATFGVGGPEPGVAHHPTSAVGQDVVLQPDGKMLVVGKDGSVGNVQVTRYDAGGQLDPTFKPGAVPTGTAEVDIGGNDTPTDLALDAEGRILAVGATIRSGEDPVFPAFVLRFEGGPFAEPTPTGTPTPSLTAVPTITPTPTPSMSTTPTATSTATPTGTPTTTTTLTPSRTSTPASATRTPTPSSTAVPGALGSFQCYSVGRERVAAIPGVGIADQLGEGVADLRRPTRLCAPADVGGDDPTAPQDVAHLLGYELGTRTPHFRKRKDVLITNRFSQDGATVNVIRPVLLLAPTGKSLSADPGAPEGLGLDRFQCYHVTNLKTRADDLHITDQFGTLTVDVKRPLRLCLPAHANDQGIVDGTQGLTCYRVRPERPRQFSGRDPVFVHDQFGPREIAIKRPTELCVPTTIAVP